MPQLVPFYFINQFVFAFVLLIAIVYLFSKNILPRLIRVFHTRSYVTKV